ncbi:MAG: hypothetical protein Q8K50_02480 [Hydrogenophaga sp.]|nr:hypothetical protein [Hydrogenophaga sp.]
MSEAIPSTRGTRSRVASTSPVNPSRWRQVHRMKRQPQRASLMCANRVRGCCNRFSSSTTLWPVSNAVELATARITAFRLGFFGCSVGVLRMWRASGLTIGNVLNFDAPKPWGNGHD